MNIQICSLKRCWEDWIREWHDRSQGGLFCLASGGPEEGPGHGGERAWEIRRKDGQNSEVDELWC